MMRREIRNQDKDNEAEEDNEEEEDGNKEEQGINKGN